MFLRLDTKTSRPTPITRVHSSPKPLNPILKHLRHPIHNLRQPMPRPLPPVPATSMPHPSPCHTRVQSCLCPAPYHANLPTANIQLRSRASEILHRARPQGIFLASRSHKFRPSFRCRTDLRFFSFFLFLACSLPTRKRAPYSLRINDFAEESASPPRALVRSVWVVRRSKPLHCEIRWPGRRACRMSHAMTCLSVPATTTSRSSQPVHLTSSSQRTPYTYL